jgi:hypothetical protein
LKTSNLLLAVAAVAALGGAIVVYVFDPALYSFYPPCVFRKITGLLCPGCGMTRALHQLLHGHFAAALQLNAVGIVMAPLLAAGATVEARRVLNGAAVPRFVEKPWIAWTVVLILVGWGVVRNV